MNDDVIFMTHPEVDAPATAFRSAYDAVWRRKGWILVDPANVDSLKKEDLERVAKSAGIPVSGTKSEVAAKLSEEAKV